MPKEIVLEDGTTQNVYEESEVAEFKTAAEKSKELEGKFATLSTELGVGEGETVEDRLKEMKNSNYARFRKGYDAQKKYLKEQHNVEFAEDGTLITNKPLSMEDIQKTTNQAVDNALANRDKEQLLSQFNSEEKKTVEFFFDKLMVTGGSIQENMELAITKAFPDRSPDAVKQSFSFGSGGAPRVTSPNGKTFTETEDGKALLDRITKKSK